QMRWCSPRSPVDPMYMPGRLRTASSPSRTVMDEAPYSACAFFFWAATGGMLSLGLHASGPVTAAVAYQHSTVKRGLDRFSGRVSTYLTAPWAGFFNNRRVPTCNKLVCFVLAALRRLLSKVGLGMNRTAGQPLAVGVARTSS